jgi:hypothetical protein
MRRTYIPFQNIDADNVRFAMGADSKGKVSVSMSYGASMTNMAIVSPAAVTLWPRCTGDGNYGTMWGPQDVTKAKFTLDLTDTPIDENPNADFEEFQSVLEKVDDKLLEFVYQNQLKLLNRKNLGKEEVRMLQIRSVRPKYDKSTGNMSGHSVNLSTTKYAWDGIGGKYERRINVCDLNGKVVPNGVVCPGDVVAATMYANLVYTGVGGDKFGIHWGFEDIQVVCQRCKLNEKTTVSSFGKCGHPAAQAYVDYTNHEALVGQFESE